MKAHQGPIDHVGRSIDFGRTAADYDRYRPGFPDTFFDILVEHGWITRGLAALDLGTGTGSVALGLASAGLNVTGLDISRELLVAARSEASLRELVVSFVEGTAESIGYMDSTFDVVTAGQCWWWFDSDIAVAEAKRVLRPGGRLIICDFSYLPLPGNVAERTEDLVLAHNPGWTMSGGTRIHPEQVGALDHGGFLKVESFSYVVDIEFSHTSWRGRIRTCNGVGSALTDQEADRFDADLEGLLKDEFPGTLSIPHRVFATSGVRR
ncbi:MAG: methyltransferase domain-containing protein [Actinomycetia bacterium]|nr:methyltransferase domain-containing protein [Actinomycetes bacterium]